jgi:hypothetical protein
MIDCTNAVELKNVGEHLYKAQCKCKNKISKIFMEIGKGMTGF